MKHHPTSRTTRWALIALAWTAVGSFVAVPSTASARDTPSEQPAPSDSTPWAELEAIAARDGTVPLIVTLKASGRLRHELSNEQARRQADEVRNARAGLQNEMKTKQLLHLKSMDDLPIMAFAADLSDLATLRSSKYVSSVVLDESRPLPEIVDEAESEPAPAEGPSGTDVGGAGTPSTTTSDGSASQLSAWWDYYRIGVDKAKNAGYTGAGQVVAVIDTGVERTHSWLSGDVVAEACYSTPRAGYPGACPNGATTQFGTGAAKPCPWTGCAHGTHVAHTAAGLYGVASGARIIAVQAFHYEPATATSPAGPYVYDSDLIWAMKYVYDLRGTFRIASVNMSLGGGGYTSYCDNLFAATTDAGKVGGWIKALTTVNIGAVVASGNDNYYNAVGKPACFSYAVSVGNTTLTPSGADAVYGNVKGGSNSNATLDLLAPGTDICSAIPGNTSNCAYIGTSMAAPHVAGAFAVLRQYRPAATVAQVVTALQRSGVAVTDSRNGVVRSRINVWSALGTIYAV